MKVAIIAFYAGAVERGIETLAWYLNKMLPYETKGTPNEPWEWEHIRFFNLKIIKRMFNVVGFHLGKVYGVNNPRLKIQCKLMKFFPSLFSSILVVIGIKK